MAMACEVMMAMVCEVSGGDGDAVCVWCVYVLLCA